MPFPHNTSYKATRSQGTTLNVLLALFIILSVIWFIFEYRGTDFPMEPIVVLVGGLATLFASYWAWKPSYATKRVKGRMIGDYKENNGDFTIGSGDLEFTLRFSSHSAESIYIYNDPDSIEALALAKDAGNFGEIKDCSVFNFGNRVREPKEEEIVVLKNKKGNYALVQILNVLSESHGDKRNEVLFSFIINPDGKTDFS